MPGALYGSTITYGQASVAYNDPQLAFTPTATGNTYYVNVVDQAGNRYAENVECNVEDIRYELNQAGTASFTVHALEVSATQIQVLSREVQIWRDSTLLFWGVPVRSEADENTVKFQCQGLLWYFDRRFFGRADRHNLLLNADMEAGGGSGIDFWVATGTTLTWDSTKRISGAHSAKLVQANSSTDTFIRQQVGLVAGGVGALVTLVAWYYIDPGGWDGPALDGRGMYLSIIQEDNVFDHFSNIEITNDTARGTWQRAETTIHVAANDVVTLEVRLYSPGGTIWWDATSLTLMESLSLGQSDQSEIARQIVGHAQDPVYAKSNLLIGSTTPTTGVIRDRFYQFAEHGNIGQALQELPQLDNGLDYDIVLTPTTRVFNTYYPRKGTYRPALALTQTDVSHFAFKYDGQAAVSSVTVLGDGDGPDREEGGAIDQTLFNGLTLEEVVSAPNGSPIDALDGRASELLRAHGSARILEVTVPDSSKALIGVVTTGDSLPVTFDWGYTQISGDWRIMAMTIDASNNATTLELNPV